MNIQELSTASSFICRSSVVAEYRYLGIGAAVQQFFHGNRYSESYMDALPDFVKLASIRTYRDAYRQPSMLNRR